MFGNIFLEFGGVYFIFLGTLKVSMGIFGDENNTELG
jgi:hypothetical protein